MYNVLHGYFFAFAIMAISRFVCMFVKNMEIIYGILPGGNDRLIGLIYGNKCYSYI